MAEAQANTEEENKKEEREKREAKYETLKDWSKRRNIERKLANDHFSSMLI